MDTVTKAKRSQMMAAVKGKGNRSTEWKIRSRLISAGISGWRVNDKRLFGTPDFTFERKKVAIFLDGCFWHGCKLCKNIPTSNRNFWLQKIKQNRKRDRLVDKKLKNTGWKVIHFWEHSIKKDPNGCVEKILATIKTKKTPETTLGGQLSNIELSALPYSPVGTQIFCPSPRFIQ